MDFHPLFEISKEQRHSAYLAPKRAGSVASVVTDRTERLSLQTAPMEKVIGLCHIPHRLQIE
jgi:hypothetical protein